VDLRRRGRLLLLAAALAALVLPVASAAGPVQDSARYLLGRQQPGGGFAEQGGRPSPGLTAWAVIGLRTAGTPASRLSEARAYLAASTGDLRTLTDAELVLTALARLGAPPDELVDRVRTARRRSGAIGATLNATMWGVIALHAAGERVPAASIRYLLRNQHSSGGWSWAVRGAPDSNDTAAAVLALRAGGVAAGGAPIRKGLRYLRRLQNADGGFELVPGRGSDAQSTGWVVQAFLAAKAGPGAAAYRYLARLKRADGSLRYNERYAGSPVWVTSQALPALARRPLIAR
jgi:prenyltransferase/squalene oxidase-like repeat protein